jgi:inner membrane protein
MKAYTHIMGGILFFLILAYLLNISNPFLGVFCAAWISVFPNIVDKKSGFVCLNKKRRFKTGSNQDKAVFIFLLFLIVPIILFTTGLGNFFLGENMNVAFAVSNQSNNSSISPQNSNIYLSFKLDEACNKNITFEKVNENKTSIVVQDINTTVKK